MSFMQFMYFIWVCVVGFGLMSIILFIAVLPTAYGSRLHNALIFWAVFTFWVFVWLLPIPLLSILVSSALSLHRFLESL